MKDELEDRLVWYEKNGKIFGYYRVDGFLIPQSSNVYKESQLASTHNYYETKSEAMYACVVKNLQAGKPLDNYKRSPYYNEYVQRLKIEHPEYII